MPAKLTTHVLDTARGIPAAGMAIEFFRIEGRTLTLIHSAITNDDGRLDAPLLEGAALAAGAYELRFHVRDYFARTPGASAAPDSPAFLDVVPVRFGIADPGANLHVPLLVSPFGYTTYRGS